MWKRNISDVKAVSVKMGKDEGGRTQPHPYEEK